MKQIKILYITLLLLLGCSSIGSSEKKSDPIFDVYLQDFVEQSKGVVKQHHLNNIIIVFHDYEEKENSEHRILGTCHYNIFGKNTIHINKDWWYNISYSDYVRMEVVFHELGHCVLYRPHTEPSELSEGIQGWLEQLMFDLGLFQRKGYLKDGCPSSMMHPFSLDDWCIMVHYNYYMNELFNPKKYGN